MTTLLDELDELDELGAFGAGPAGSPSDRLAKALTMLGRVVKTIYVLRYPPRGRAPRSRSSAAQPRRVAPRLDRSSAMVCRGTAPGPSMIRSTAELKIAAERILGLESAASKRGAARSPAAAVVSEQLRRVLSTLLGAAGFRALLSRAVTLAKAEVPELRSVVVQLDGSLAGLSLHDGLGKNELADGEIVLVAHILGLLVTFVGETLMLRLVNDAWPKVRLDDLDFDKVNRD